MWFQPPWRWTVFHIFWEQFIHPSADFHQLSQLSFKNITYHHQKPIWFSRLTHSLNGDFLILKILRFAIWVWINTYFHTIFLGLFTSILTQLFWCELQGYISHLRCPTYFPMDSNGVFFSHDFPPWNHPEVRARPACKACPARGGGPILPRPGPLGQLEDLPCLMGKRWGKKSGKHKMIFTKMVIWMVIRSYYDILWGT